MKKMNAIVLTILYLAPTHSPPAATVGRCQGWINLAGATSRCSLGQPCRGPGRAQEVRDPLPQHSGQLLSPACPAPTHRAGVCCCWRLYRPVFRYRDRPASKVREASLLGTRAGVWNREPPHPCGLWQRRVADHAAVAGKCRVNKSWCFVASFWGVLSIVNLAQWGRGTRQMGS